MSSFSALVAFLAVNLALIILRYRMPDHRRPFVVPLSVGRMPIVPLAAIGSIGLLLVSFDPAISAISLILLLAVLVLAVRQYLTQLRARRRMR